MTLEPATDSRDTPCTHCPWLTANQGKPHPDGWYTKKNLRRLWALMRRGEHMSCHPTDPANPVSEQAQAKGYRAAPETSSPKSCIGAYVAQQREFWLLTEAFGGKFPAYRKARPRGLTKQGVIAVIQDFMFSGTILGGGGQRVQTNLESDVTVPGLEWPFKTQSDEGQSNGPAL